jgi:tRNA pseudouridine32 synthase / 23S rRNA pseudouridine746 synthase
VQFSGNYWVNHYTAFFYFFFSIYLLAVVAMSRSDFIVPPCFDKHTVLYADDALLVVDKPSKLLSVPGRLEANKDCLITRIQETHSSALIVHRLDFDTSGIMVIALNKEVHRHLSRQFQDRETKKQYTAHVDGLVELDQGEIDLPIVCDWPNRPKQMICYEHGKASQTQYTVVSRDPETNTTIMALTPITGRSHQLRIHMRELGHPILGCDMYAYESAYLKSPRMLLHGCFLAFTHPDSGEWLEFNCPAPF